MVGIVTDSASDVSPDLGIKNGEVFPYVRMRSRARAVEWLYSFATKFKKVKALAIEYSTNLAEAKALAGRIAMVVGSDIDLTPVSF